MVKPFALTARPIWLQFAYILLVLKRKALATQFQDQFKFRKVSQIATVWLGCCIQSKLCQRCRLAVTCGHFKSCEPNFCDVEHVNVVAGFLVHLVEEVWALLFTNVAIVHCPLSTNVYNIVLSSPFCFFQESDNSGHTSISCVTVTSPGPPYTPLQRECCGLTAY